MAKAFYLKLAIANIKRSREVYIPHFIATAIISGVFFLISGLVFSDGLTNLPSGPTSQAVFSAGIFLFAVFDFGFMLYINSFLMKRRKREFGLYGVLGLSKRHIGRLLVWENVLIIGLGVLCGMIVALIFGKLLFLLLLKAIHSAPNSEFVIGPQAYVLTLGLFAVIFVVTSIINLVRVHISNPIQLLYSEKKGDKDSRFVLPRAIIGFILLGVAYYFALTINIPATALGVFFLLAVLVILATNALFVAGSIVILKLLRKRKKLYYKPKNFIAISGMFQRMKQNASGLAVICILSTMLIITVASTTALYLGQEDQLQSVYPFDIQVWLSDTQNEEQLKELDSLLATEANEHGLMMSASFEGKAGENVQSIIDDGYTTMEHSIVQWGNSIMFDLEGRDEDYQQFVDQIPELIEPYSTDGYGISDINAGRMDAYALTGGLLFLGVFFGILFLAITVLVIYFKQITEGYEDKERFAILQKVGMSDKQVKETINRQILWVFFLPLVVAICHTAVAAKIICIMLQTFQLYNSTLVLICLAVTCAVFALIYLIVFRLTAKVYYRIVKW
ncbi:MAG: ABC transporter permease [Firmicutes bacterium]|nr:ABC transporter permease [Bacillota bacterium]